MRTFALNQRLQAATEGIARRAFIAWETPRAVTRSA
jgi:hypothetical protein